MPYDRYWLSLFGENGMLVCFPRYFMVVTNVHPVADKLLPRTDKERLLCQSGRVFWLYGLSGSGKSTLAIGLERSLHENGLVTAVLDGDNLRSGLNKDLGFSDEDREENLRRVAEMAKLFVESGLVTIVSFITPRQEFRETARAIVGEDDFREVYVKASYATCEERDVKGLYAKARAGEIPDFTGKASAFEEPNSPWLTIDTEKSSPEESLVQLTDAVLPLVRQVA